MRWIIFVIVILFSCSGCMMPEYKPKSLTTANGTFIGFYEFLPYDYATKPNKKYPLIIFLHGVGERGDGKKDLYLLLNQPMPKFIYQGANMTFEGPNGPESFLVLCPQLDKQYNSWENFY